MKFGTRSSPRVKVVVGCLRSELVDEVMSSIAKTPKRGESDRFEVDVELTGAAAAASVSVASDAVASAAPATAPDTLTPDTLRECLAP